MEKKYIHESRYKKGTTRKRRDARTVRSNINSKAKTQVDKQIKPNVKKTKKTVKKAKRENKTTNIIFCIILLILIAVISRAILKDENEPFIPLPFIKNSNDQVIKIGVITEESLLQEDTNNVVLNELYKYYKEMLLTINDDYSITYGVISNVNKISNKEYVIYIDLESKMLVEELMQVFNKCKANTESSYYLKFQNIESMTVVNNNALNIKLKEDDPYFVYCLEMQISKETNTNNSNYIKDVTSTEDMLVLNRNKKADKELPLKLIIKRYKDVYAIVDAYKSRDINMFVTNAENVETLLGRYEYNITRYRNGQSVFLFASPSSKLFSLKEVRQAIAYSIDRDKIIQDVFESKGLKIDLPYIYDDVKYKYDIYAAENLLLTNGYKKSNNVYSKIEKGVKTTLELDLIVNKNDETKVSIAKAIKNNLTAIGIKVNLEQLTEKKLQSRIQKNDYDLVVASVNLNKNPDINFVSNNLFITNQMEQAIKNIENSTIQELSKNINNIQKIMSEEIATIGIYSDVSYLVYSKDIIGLKNVSYMNLFKGIIG